MAMNTMWTGRPPKTAVFLDAFGLFPFVSLGLIAVAGPPGVVEDARAALAAYGAIILSFLGGAHWGYCIARAQRGAPSNGIRLFASVTPAIVAWVALLAPMALALYALSAALAAMLAFDVWAARHGWAPIWYPTLRWPLSAGAVTASLVAIAA